MGRAKEGAPLVALVRMAIPLCQQAEQAIAQARRGAKAEFKDWQIAVLIMVAVLKKKKSKSSQYRFLSQHGDDLQAWLGLQRLPVRSTYCRRYRTAHRLFQAAMRLQTAGAQGRGWLHARCVSVDKSVIPARGPVWHAADRRRGQRGRGVDEQASWTYSRHHGWQFGYSYEVVVCRTKQGAVWPMLASVETASAKESRTFMAQIPQLPRATRYVLADKGYDSNAIGEAVEWDAQHRRTGRRFLCPQIYRRGEHGRGQGPRIERGARAMHRQRREQRRRFLHGRQGRRIYRERSQSVEPFHEWFKELFELSHRCWHRGLANNQTLILAALFAYQLLLRYNRQRKNHNAQVAWILDGL
jgi:hypothetical protein